jgi:hypothetical protein
MHYRKLYNSDWKMIEEMIEKKLSNWKRKIPICRWLTGAHQFCFDESYNVHVVFF